jgi:probable HAF family extracellular repeat protein
VGWIYDPATGNALRASSPFAQTVRSAVIGINDAGLVLACADNGSYLGMYVWDSVADTTAPIAGALNRCIGKVSNTGFAVANSESGAAVLMEYATLTVETVPGLGGATIGYDVDAAGTVVGSSTTSSALRAFLWRRTSDAANDLGTLGGAEAEARGIGVVEDVVGDADTQSGERHAFVWRASWGMIDLGTLPGDTTSVAHGISPSGTIVGSSGPAGARHAVRWLPPP